jgi:uncharacterized protein YjbI with pentapeptide repeats
MTNAPQWLLDAKTENAEVDVTTSGWVTWNSGDFLGGDFWGGNFLGGNFLGGNFRGGNFRGGDFWGGNFRGGNFLGGDFLGGNFLGGDFWGGNFRGGNFLGGNFRGGSVKGNAALKLRAHVGLYPYQVTAALLADGSRWVQMGCLWKSLEDWEKIGIRKSNEAEFPDDGSDKCEERVAAFEFAKAAALRMR